MNRREFEEIIEKQNKSLGIIIEISNVNTVCRRSPEARIIQTDFEYLEK